MARIKPKEEEQKTDKEGNLKKKTGKKRKSEGEENVEKKKGKNKESIKNKERKERHKSFLQVL